MKLPSYQLITNCTIAGVFLYMLCMPAFASTDVGYCQLSQPSNSIDTNVTLQLDSDTNRPGYEFGKDKSINFANARGFGNATCRCEDNRPTPLYFKTESTLPRSGDFFKLDNLGLDVALYLSMVDATGPRRYISAAQLTTEVYNNNEENICLINPQSEFSTFLADGWITSGISGYVVIRLQDTIVTDIKSQSIEIASLKFSNKPDMIHGNDTYIKYLLNFDVDSNSECLVDINDSIEEAEINLGMLSRSQFKAVGERPESYEDKDVNINIGCNYDTSTRVKVSLNAVANPYYANAINSSLSSIGVILVDKNDNILAPGGNMMAEKIDSRSHRLDLKAYPVSTLPEVQSGDFSAKASFDVSFN